MDSNSVVKIDPIPMPIEQIDPNIFSTLEEIEFAVNYKGKATSVNLPIKYEKALSWIFATGALSVSERIAKAAQAADVTTNTIHKWLKEPKVKAYIHERINYFNLRSGQTIEKWVNFLWDGMNGKIEGTSFQARCADMLGKFYGVYQEKTINESYNRTEQLIFVQSQESNPQLEAARQSGDGGEFRGQVYLPNGGQEIRENQTTALLASPGLSETKV